MAVAAPLSPDRDNAAIARAARRLRTYLGLDAAHAAHLARRCLLYHRDRSLHATLVLNAAPPTLRTIVEAIQINGMEQLGDGTRGRLFVSFHYGPYNSLLWLALAHAMAPAHFPPLTVMLNSVLDRKCVLPEDRRRELVGEGLISPGWLTLFDAAEHGRAGARMVAAKLGAGGSVVVFPDAWFLPPEARNALLCRIGQGSIGLPRGVQWLAEKTGCQVIALRIQPEAQGHRIVLDPVPDVPAALEVLGGAIAREPAPWEGWTRDQPYF